MLRGIKDMSVEELNEKRIKLKNTLFGMYYGEGEAGDVRLELTKSYQEVMGELNKRKENN